MNKKNIKPINPEKKKKKKKKDMLLNSDDKFLKFIYNNKKIKDINDENKKIKDINDENKNKK